MRGGVDPVRPPSPARAMRAGGLAIVACLLLTCPRVMLALEARIREIRTVGESVRASIELADLLTETLGRVLQSGSPLHVRIQAEIWEDRPLWDKLVRPALVTVYRIVRDPTTSQVAVSDAVGTIVSAAQLPDPLSLRVEIAPARELDEDGRYYVRILATIGTIAERDIEETGAAVFGRHDGNISLGTMGRLVFTAVLQVTDYLQSVSTEARSDRFRGRDMRR
ncbi:MAG TPA: hypothetical protein VD833_22645 [Vicinamibacterales bacterium]|nr:hypothetical protein [Vicinamibacterales bacterium]